VRGAFEVGKRAPDAGDYPFGALVADDEGKVLMKQGSGYAARAPTAPPTSKGFLESRVARHHSLAFLARCTLYTAAEPRQVRRGGPASGASSAASARRG